MLALAEMRRAELITSVHDRMLAANAAWRIGPGDLLRYHGWIGPHAYACARGNARRFRSDFLLGAHDLCGTFALLDKLNTQALDDGELLNRTFSIHERMVEVQQESSPSIWCIVDWERGLCTEELQAPKQRTLKRQLEHVARRIRRAIDEVGDLSGVEGVAIMQWQGLPGRARWLVKEIFSLCLDRYHPLFGDGVDDPLCDVDGLLQALEVALQLPAVNCKPRSLRKDEAMLSIYGAFRAVAGPNATWLTVATETSRTRPGEGRFSGAGFELVGEIEKLYEVELLTARSADRMKGYARK